VETTEWNLNGTPAKPRRMSASMAFHSAKRKVCLVIGTIVLYDDNHSMTEDRYITIGFSDRGRLLTVVYTERDGKTRIISARTATKSEAEAYAKA
jgi:uncharacterized DUF497 family protein